MLEQIPDADPVETREWLDSVDAVVEYDGRDRMGHLLDTVVDYAQDLGVSVGAATAFQPRFGAAARPRRRLRRAGRTVARRAADREPVMRRPGGSA